MFESIQSYELRSLSCQALQSCPEPSNIFCLFLGSNGFGIFENFNQKCFITTALFQNGNKYVHIYVLRTPVKSSMIIVNISACKYRTEEMWRF